MTFAFALSLDAMAAAFAYGNGKVNIRWTSALIIGTVCSVFLFASLLVGKIIHPFLKPEFGKIICFVILLMLGIVKLFDFAIKALIRRKKVIQSSFGFSFAHLHFILNIYADPIEADKDLSKSLSAGEAVALAIALSLDGLAAGVGFSLSGGSIAPIVIASFFFGILAIKSGEFLGRKLACHAMVDLSWMSGALLIILAIIKMRG